MQCVYDIQALKPQKDAFVVSLEHLQVNRETTAQWGIHKRQKGVPASKVAVIVKHGQNSTSLPPFISIILSQIFSTIPLSSTLQEVKEAFSTV